MLACIDAARESVCLEMYTFSDGSLGQQFRDALIAARQRGVKIGVLLDALGSMGLAADYWRGLVAAGGDVRLFNPLTFDLFSFRNHRKLLVCDRRIAFVGGFNIASEYQGDGVRTGWRDIGLKIEGPLAEQLAASFDEMFARADGRRKRFMRLRRFKPIDSVTWPAEQILFSGPGRVRNPIKRALRKDLQEAREVRIMVAYFLPTWRLRRDLARVVRKGGRVQLILAGKSDVLLSRLAAQSLYRRFLKGGVQIFEYQPQVLHAKLVIVDDIVYVGSSNLDQRSLQINYELMIRFQNPEIARQAREVFDINLTHCHEIQAEEWRRTRTLWQKLKQRLAYFVLVKIDPYMARRNWRALRD
jgi:cardiolipin synthase